MEGSIGDHENLITIGMPRSLGRRAWRAIMSMVVLPRLRSFQPDLIVVSAGFDAHRADSLNLGYLGLVEADYQWITRQLTTIADECCGGRIVSLLEGGYRVQGGPASAFAQSVAQHVEVLTQPTTGKWSREVCEMEVDLQAKSAIEARAARIAALSTPAQAPAPSPAAAAISTPVPAPAPAAAAISAPVPTPVPAPAPIPAEEPSAADGGRKRRRTERVDYVALEQKLAQEEKARGK